MFSGVPEMFSGVPKKSFGVPEMFFGAPEMSFGVPEMFFGVPEKSFGVPEMFSGVPEKSFGAPEMFFGVPEKLFSARGDVPGRATALRCGADGIEGRGKTCVGVPGFIFFLVLVLFVSPANLHGRIYICNR
ncbi:MAG: hypothetical protein LBK07_07400, partial [Tannerella sp.]|nr:hypothetical protein [Tannerella sp.]